MQPVSKSLPPAPTAQVQEQQSPKPAEKKDAPLQKKKEPLLELAKEKLTQIQKSYFIENVYTLHILQTEMLLQIKQIARDQKFINLVFATTPIDENFCKKLKNAGTIQSFLYEFLSEQMAAFRMLREFHSSFKNKSTPNPSVLENPLKLGRAYFEKAKDRLPLCEYFIKHGNPESKQAYRSLCENYTLLEKILYDEKLLHLGIKNLADSPLYSHILLASLSLQPSTIDLYTDSRKAAVFCLHIFNTQKKEKNKEIQEAIETLNKYTLQIAGKHRKNARNLAKELKTQESHFIQIVDKHEKHSMTFLKEVLQNKTINQVLETIHTTCRHIRPLSPRWNAAAATLCKTGETLFPELQAKASVLENFCTSETAPKAYDSSTFISKLPKIHKEKIQNLLCRIKALQHERTIWLNALIIEPLRIPFLILNKNIAPTIQHFHIGRDNYEAIQKKLFFKHRWLSIPGISPLLVICVNFQKKSAQLYLELQKKSNLIPDLILQQIKNSLRVTLEPIYRFDNLIFCESTNLRQSQEDYLSLIDKLHHNMKNLTLLGNNILEALPNNKILQNHAESFVQMGELLENITQMFPYEGLPYLLHPTPEKKSLKALPNYLKFLLDEIKNDQFHNLRKTLAILKNYKAKTDDPLAEILEESLKQIVQKMTEDKRKITQISKKISSNKNIVPQALQSLISCTNSFGKTQIKSFGIVFHHIVLLLGEKLSKDLIWDSTTDVIHMRFFLIPIFELEAYIDSSDLNTKQSTSPKKKTSSYPIKKIEEEKKPVITTPMLEEVKSVPVQKKPPLSALQTAEQFLTHPVVCKKPQSSELKYVFWQLKVSQSAESAQYHLATCKEIEQKKPSLSPQVKERLQLIEGYTLAELALKTLSARLSFQDTDHHLFSGEQWLIYSHNLNAIYAPLKKHSSRNQKKKLPNKLKYGELVLSQYNWFSIPADNFPIFESISIISVINTVGNKLSKTRSAPQTKNSLAKALRTFQAPPAPIKLSKNTQALKKEVADLTAVLKKKKIRSKALDDVLNFSLVVLLDEEELLKCPRAYCSAHAIVQVNLLAQVFHYILRSNPMIDYENHTIQNSSGGGARPLHHCHNLIILWELIQSTNPKYKDIIFNLTLFAGDYRYPHSSLTPMTWMLIEVDQIAAFLEKIEKEGEFFTLKEFKKLKKWFPEKNHSFKAPLENLLSTKLKEMRARTAEAAMLSTKLLAKINV